MKAKNLYLSILLSISFSSCSTTTPVWVDVHGAGSQRSDPKTGDSSLYPDGHGPQGDSIRINNLARAVRKVSEKGLPYTIVGTNQSTRYDNQKAISDRTQFIGQDADNKSLKPSYTDNGDGTITDNNTGLIWQKSPGKKLSWAEAHEKLKSFKLAGKTDWRIPTIKELYSLIIFSGKDVNPNAIEGSVPFIDTKYFDFVYGDPNNHERVIDSQYMSSTKYVSTTMKGDETVFGVNFADGRIKGYGMTLHGRDKTFFVMFVRGNKEYGKNNFIDNGDNTITDLATGLMWMKNDAGPMNWAEALNYANELDFAGYSDWRLPNAKELQSIVDYSRSPDTTSSAAIDPIFNTRIITNEAGNEDYGNYWASTTHASSAATDLGDAGSAGVYVSFGRSLGNMSMIQTHEPKPLDLDK